MCLFANGTTWRAAFAPDPATWMLDISTVTAEERRKEDLAELFAQSQLRQCVANPTETLRKFASVVSHAVPRAPRNVQRRGLRFTSWRHTGIRFMNSPSAAHACRGCVNVPPIGG